MKKPVRWICGSFLLLLLALGTSIGGYLYAANQVPPYTPASVQLPSPNAYDDYVAAAAQVKVPQDLMPQGKSEPTTAVLRQSTRDNRKALAGLRRGFAHQYLAPGRYDLDALYLELEGFRSLGRALVGEGKLAEREGRYRDAARSYLDCMRLGNDVPRSGRFLYYLTGISIKLRALAPLQHCVDHLDVGTARQAARELSRLDEMAPTAADALAMEREWLLASLSPALRKWRPKNYAAFLESATDGYDELEGWKMYLWPKQAILGNIRAYMDALVADARQPYYAHPAAPPLPNDPFSRYWLPDPESATYVGYPPQALMRIVQVQLAARAYTLEHREPPSSMQALVPDYLDTPPADPFVPRPISLKISDGKALIYSVGPDEVDDGGTSLKGSPISRSKGDLLFVSPQK